jgi:hypothetical protein
MSDTFVVLWRGGRRQPWAVQPHIHSAVGAAQVARALVDHFSGEAWSIPVEIPPPGEDASDSEPKR